MTWWRWTLVGLLVALAIGGLAYHQGVTAERRRSDRAHAEILQALRDREARAAAREVALAAELVARETALQALLDRARASEAREADAERATRATRAQLAQAMTAADSLGAYVPLVAGLTEQLVIAKSSTQTYREALQASQAKSATLMAQLQEKDQQLQEKDATIAELRQPVVVAPSRGGLGRAVETTAIAAATARACEASVLSVGCLAGAGITVKRFW